VHAIKFQFQWFKPEDYTKECNTCDTNEVTLRVVRQGVPERSFPPVSFFRRSTISRYLQLIGGLSNYTISIWVYYYYSINFDNYRFRKIIYFFYSLELHLYVFGFNLACLTNLAFVAAISKLMRYPALFRQYLPLQFGCAKADGTIFYYSD